MHDVRAGAAEQRTEAAVVAELTSVQSDEVEDCAHGFALALAQTSAELLKEERRTLRRSEQKQGVNGWEIDALIE